MAKFREYSSLLKKVAQVDARKMGRFTRTFRLGDYVDYEEFDRLEEGLGRFHAQWRRENPTDGTEEAGQSNEEFLFGGENASGEGNYTILEAKDAVTTSAAS